MSNHRVIELAKKIKALADRGIDGEQRNAIELLNDFLEKHGLTMDDIESETRADQFFACQKKQQQILRQIFFRVLGTDASIWNSARKRYGFVVEVTPAEQIEILAMFKHYWRAYEQQLEAFNYAFIMRNSLFAQDGEGRNYEDLTQKEKDEFDRAQQMAGGMDKSEFFKQLND